MPGAQHAGSKKPEIDVFSNKSQEKRDVQKYTGFDDFTSLDNLKLQDDGTIIIIDTEYGSFTNDNGMLLSEETEAVLGGSEFSFPVVDILGEDVFNYDDTLET